VDPAPKTRYARNGEAFLAYQQFGDGPIDIVEIESWVHHVEAFWALPEIARQRRRLASIGRLIILDRRGTGLSDPVAPRDLPDHDMQVADVIAVMDSAGVDEAAILGFNEGGGLALQLAAAYPERCRSLVLWNTAARMTVAPDYPWGAPEAVLLDLVERQARDWADNDPSYLRTLVPSRADDERFLQSLADLGRTAVTPGTVAHFFRETVLTDLRGYLADVQAPTLVLQRAQGPIVSAGMGRYVADHIADARYVEIEGTDHMWFSEHGDDVLDEIEEFLTGSLASADPDRRLLTVLFTDIVGSTATAAELGDTRWRATLDRHDEIVRSELARFGGREIDTTGDGFLATFDAPGRAIRCARAMGDTLAGIDVSIRAGVHTGEVEVRGEQIGGLTVHIGARVAALGDAGDLLVSSTVKELMAGSELTFLDHGEHVLKGVPGSWRIYEVERE
jgi:class 3 adenylate cyclase